MTYGDIAQRLAKERGLPRNGRLTGYAGGLHRKAWLLSLEQSAGKLL